MPHMNNIWFNQKRQSYQLGKSPETDKDLLNLNRDGENYIAEDSKDWRFIGCFEGDNLVQIVSTFTALSHCHLELSK